MGEAADHRAGGDRRWRLYALGLIVAVGATVSGVLLGAARSHRHGPLFVTLFTVVAAALVAVTVLWSMRRQLNRPASRKLRSVSPAQRRAVIRAVNSAQPLTEEQRGVAEAQREQLRSSAARLAWALPFAVLGSVMIAIRDYGGMRPLWVAMAIVELLCAVSAVLLFRRQSRRIENALDASRSST